MQGDVARRAAVDSTSIQAEVTRPILLLFLLVSALLGILRMRNVLNSTEIVKDARYRFRFSFLFFFISACFCTSLFVYINGPIDAQVVQVISGYLYE